MVKTCLAPAELFGQDLLLKLDNIPTRLEFQLSRRQDTAYGYQTAGLGLQTELIN